MIVWTHPCRIYRCRLSQKHDLSLVRDAEDIYEVDKWCRMEPSSAELLDLPGQGELGAVQRLVSFWFPSGTDIVEGYLIKVKKPRVIDGVREPVSALLASSVAAGGTELDVDEPWGFESGDVVEISDENVTEYVRVRTVSDYTLTLYSDEAPENSFGAGDSVAVSDFYKISALTVPPGVGPAIQAQATRIAHRSIG